jgi:hypothetical protein
MVGDLRRVIGDLLVIGDWQSVGNSGNREIVFNNSITIRQSPANH